MKTLVIGDTHLTHRFDQRKFDFLYRIISNSDNVILNGDFWDYWGTSFDKFVNSEWNKLFPLLLERNCIYIYGNHDYKKLSNENVKKFCKLADEEYLNKIGDNTFVFCHGDRILRKNDKRLWLKIYRGYVHFIATTFLRNSQYIFLDNLEYVGYFVLGSKYMTNANVSRKSNDLLSRYNKGNNSWLICSETHNQTIDLENKYANTGNIEHSYGHYLIIDERGNITKYQERY